MPILVWRQAVFANCSFSLSLRSTLVFAGLQDFNVKTFSFPKRHRVDKSRGWGPSSEPCSLPRNLRQARALRCVGRCCFDLPFTTHALSTDKKSDHVSQMYYNRSYGVKRVGDGVKETLCSYLYGVKEIGTTGSAVALQSIFTRQFDLPATYQHITRAI